MEFKGTKGKWNIYESNHIGCTNVKFGKEEWDGYIELWHHHSNKEEAKANAQLIAHAPEMLEALIKIEHILTHDVIEPNSPLQEKLFDLINRATTI